jgi:flagellar motor switch protein FliN
MSDDKLSQDDIDKLLSGVPGESPPEQGGAEKSAGGAASAGNATPPIEGAKAPDDDKTFKYLDLKEIDALGELGNISMGSSATTLSMLLGNKVEITAPTVKELESIDEIQEVVRDRVVVEIAYKAGLEGSTVFVLEVNDTAIIADLMMGGDGKVKDPEIGELQLSAVGEAMNQMIGTSATTLSSIFNTSIDITAPIVKLQKKGDKLGISQEIIKGSVVCTSFKLIVGDLINSEMVQIMPVKAAKDHVSRLLNAMTSMMEEVVPSTSSSASTSKGQSEPQKATANMGTPVASNMTHPEKPITVQPVQFTSFNDYENVLGEAGKNLDLLMDVKLNLTVELGRTDLSIKKVLELTRGSVIELDKVAGEPVDLYANGKLIAKGEVVVIEDSFGLRITGIVSPDNRLKGL